MAGYPDRLIIEPTTRCNFKCEFCVKQAPGCGISEGDLVPDVMQAVTPLMPRAVSVTFTGIGEPLCYDGLEACLEQARDAMPHDSHRGFQTNGKLLTRERAASLLKAGMNRICISVDSIGEDLFGRVRAGGRFADIENALDSLASAKRNLPDGPLSVGIEFVLMKQNMAELPGVVEWCGQQNIDFMLVTHLTPYHPGSEPDIAYLNNSHEALALFDIFRQKGLATGIDIRDYNDILWKFYKNGTDIDIYRLVAEMKDAARDRDLFVNLFHLLAEDPDDYARLREIFDRATRIADRHGLDLTLPAIRPRTERRCPFVESRSMFFTRDGFVSPCYFLWHEYQVMRAGYAKSVTPVYFGNVLERDPAIIWNDPEFSSFRNKVRRYDYPDCHAWCETRCDYVLDAPFYQDCFINDIPCCDCHWSLGFLNCLH